MHWPHALCECSVSVRFICVIIQSNQQRKHRLSRCLMTLLMSWVNIIFQDQCLFTQRRPKMHYWQHMQTETARERERRFERGREKQTMVEALDTQLQLMGSNQKPWNDAVPRRRQVCEAGDTHTQTHTHRLEVASWDLRLQQHLRLKIL